MNDVSQFSGEHLFESLNALFDSDPDIDELGLLITSNAPSLIDGGNTNNNSDKKEVMRELIAKKFDPHFIEPGKPFVLEDHKLGIAFWCIPLIYKFALKKFTKANPQIEVAIKEDKSRGNEFLQLARGMLIFNPDCYTAWNTRKRLIKGGVHTLDAEIKFLNLVFSKHPKSTEAWAHRRWVFQQKVNTTTEFGEEYLEFCSKELLLCERLAEAYPRNYYAWTHRQLVIRNGRSLQLIDSEFVRIDKWIRKNVSDHCGYQYKQYLYSVLIQQLQKEDKNSDSNSTGIFLRWLPYLVRDFHFVNRLAVQFPGHESTWCHRRFIFELFIRSAYQLDSDVRRSSSSNSSSSNNNNNDNSLAEYVNTFLPALHDFMSTKCGVPDNSDNEDFEDMYHYSYPSVKNELVFSRTCANDNQLAQHAKTRRFALAHTLWVCERGMHYLKQRREDLDASSGGTGSTVAATLWEKVFFESVNYDILEKKALECLGLLKSEDRLHKNLWENLLLAVTTTTRHQQK